MGVRDAIAKLISGGIRAFHSSPHDFERFDLSKIGTGEGAQVYGHGLYFAENPKVSGQGGEYWKQFTAPLANTTSPEGFAHRYLIDTNGDRAAAIARAEANLKHVTDRPHMYIPQQVENIASALDVLKSPQRLGARTYEVNIKADPAQMLDWDKPLAAQSDLVKEGVWSKAPYLAGGGPQRPLGTLAGSPLKLPRTAEDLQAAGIPGIKYLDEGSRGVPQEIERYRAQLADPGMAPHYDQIQKNLATWEAKPVTSNYVVFDPANIDILKKYGIAGAAAAPVVGAAMGDTYDQSQYEVQP
jgi:hypothetical protein